MRRLLFAAALLSLSSGLRAADPCVTLDDRAVAALFDQWNFALSSLDATQVAQRYWPNAVLLPTASNTPRTSPATISDYFTQFLAQRPRGRIDTRTIRSGCNLAVDMGTYTFSLMDDKGTTSEVAARYTFVYEYRDGAWKILHHHSSAMPEMAANTNADARVASADATNPFASEKPAKTEPPAPKSRESRWRRRKDYLNDDPVAAATAQKIAPAPAPAPGADAKLSAATKAPADAKSPDPKQPVPLAAAPASKKPETTAAAPAAAAPPNAVRTNMFANLTSSPSPSKFYPPEALRKKERGSVNLKVCADDKGVVTDNLEILKSSGSKLLDEAAVGWAHAVTWVPATYNRQRVEGCATVDVEFEPPMELASARR